jgi:hypothetical protein
MNILSRNHRIVNPQLRTPTTTSSSTTTTRTSEDVGFHVLMMSDATGGRYADLCLLRT